MQGYNPAVNVNYHPTGPGSEQLQPYDDFQVSFLFHGFPISNTYWMRVYATGDSVTHPNSSGGAYEWWTGG